MLFRKIPLVALLALPIVLAAANAQAAGSIEITPVSDARTWKIYANVRYNYSICYPSDLLNPGPESDNGDGVLFTAPSGASLRVWGRYNVTDESLTALAADLVDRSASITYRRLTRTTATVSGRNGDEIFYARTALEPGGETATVRSFILTYPAAEATIYDAVATRLSSCLRVLPK